MNGPISPRDLVEAPGMLRDVIEDLIREHAGPPTSLPAVADRLGIEKIVPRHDLPFSAALVSSGSRWSIVFADQTTIGRQRFSIAHELGHAYLERCKPRPPRTGDWVERICDRFAEELLMPARLFTEELKREPLNLDRLRTLSELFQCSLAATALRCERFLNDFAIFMVDEQRVLWATGSHRDRFSEQLHEHARAAIITGIRQHAEVWLTEYGRVSRWRLDAQRCDTQRQPRDALVVVTLAETSSG